jgi:hypothetical protein
MLIITALRRLHSPLLILKEGWPGHYLIMIQMLFPDGVVDFLADLKRKPPRPQIDFCNMLFIIGAATPPLKKRRGECY